MLGRAWNIRTSHDENTEAERYGSAEQRLDGCINRCKDLGELSIISSGKKCDKSNKCALSRKPKTCRTHYNERVMHCIHRIDLCLNGG